MHVPRAALAAVLVAEEHVPDHAGEVPPMPIGFGEIVLELGGEAAVALLIVCAVLIMFSLARTKQLKRRRRRREG